MRRATKIESAALKAKLEIWMAVESASKLIDEEGGRYGFCGVSQGGLKIWREAFRAVEFAKAVGASHLRMRESPDAVLKVEGVEI